MSARLLIEILLAVAVALRLAQRFLARRKARLPVAMTCPACGDARLVITEAISLPDGDLEAIACRGCNLRGAAIRDQGHRGYRMEALAWGALSTAIRACPSPRDRACSCDAHTRYARGLDAVPRDGAMFMLD